MATVGACDTNCPSDTALLLAKIGFFAGLPVTLISAWQFVRSKPK